MTDTPKDPAQQSEPAATSHDAPQRSAAQDSAAEAGHEGQPPAPTPVPTQPTAAYPTEQLTPAQGAASGQPAQPAASEQQTAPQPVMPQQPAASGAAQPAEPGGQYGAPGTYPAPSAPVDQGSAAQQPTYGQPAPAYPYAAPSEQHAAAPHPGYAGQQPGEPHLAQPQPAGQGQSFYAAAPQQDVPAQARPKDGRQNRVGLLITGFVLAGLLGGGVGAGVVGVYAAHNDDTRPVSSTGATSVTVNDPQTATDVTAVASKASPSVVTVNVTGSQEAGTGSGVILSSDGYIVTNTHVVTLDGETGSATITVTTNDGRIYQASVVGTDPVLDLAVIKLKDASGLTVASFADSDKLNVGDTAIAIGAPLGLSGTVTNGVVSALNRSIQIASSAAPSQDQQQNGSNDNPFTFGGQNGDTSNEGTISLPVIQTDAAINPGNSGGALLNAKGQVIGINVAIASTGSSSDSSDQSGSIGVGFAIPSNVAKRVADDIIKTGKATSGLLGATVSDAASASDATTVGALIKSVTSGGAAAAAGLEAGDIVTNFNGKPVTDATDLTAQVRALAGGSKATVVFERNGESRSANVTLGTLPSNG